MNRFVEVLVLLALAGVIDIASAQEGVKIFVPDTVEYKP